MATFADRLKQLRQEKNLTQAELADKLKIGRSALAMYELGKRIPKYKTIDIFADFFNVSADYLRGKHHQDMEKFYHLNNKKHGLTRLRKRLKKKARIFLNPFIPCPNCLPS